MTEPATVNMAIVGLNPSAGAPAPPEGSRDARLAAGPKWVAKGGTDSAANDAPLSVPGLLIHSANPDSKPTLMAHAAATSATNLVAAVRDTQPAATIAGAHPAAVRVSSAPDPQWVERHGAGARREDHFPPSDESGWRLLFSAPIVLNLCFFILLSLMGGLNTFLVVALGALYGTSTGLANVALTGLLTMNAFGVLVGGAVLRMVLRHTVPSVRPDDVINALRDVSEVIPTALPLITRLRQGSLGESGLVVAL